MYPYDWIPIYAVIALSIIEIINAAPETKLSLSLKRRTQTLLSRK